KCPGTFIWHSRVRTRYWTRGMHLTDLNFVDEGNADMTGNEFNFTKRRLAYDTIKTFIRFQTYPYGFQPVPQMESLLCGLFLAAQNGHIDCVQALTQGRS